MTKAAAVLCCTDLKPMALFEGSGFREYCQKLIQVGATYGAVDVDSVVPKKNSVGKR